MLHKTLISALIATNPCIQVQVDITTKREVTLALLWLVTVITNNNHANFDEFSVIEAKELTAVPLIAKLG